VLNIVSLFDMFKLGVLQENAGGKRPHNRDIYVFINRGRDQEPSMLPIIGRQVSPPASQGDSQWTTRNDHTLNPCRLYPRFPAPHAHPPVRGKAGGQAECPEGIRRTPRTTNHPPSDTPRSSFPVVPFAAAFYNRSSARSHNFHPDLRYAVCHASRISRRKRDSSIRYSSHAETPS